MASFNFRATENYITDGAGQTFVIAESFPVSRDGLTFGWVGSTAGISARDRSLTDGPKLAGGHYINTGGGNPPRLFATRSGDGTFSVRLAIGLTIGANQSQYVDIVEVDSSNVIQSTLATVVSAAPSVSGEFYDATGVKRTPPSDWTANEQPLQVTVSTGNNLALLVGDPLDQDPNFSSIAHFAYEAVATASITSVNTDNTVTDGQQDVPVIVSGFAGDITSMSLRVGADTLALSGLTGTGDNYTIDFPDISAFVADTVGLPFSSPAYQVELLATDGTDTAAINITLEPKAGWTVVETVSAVDTEGSIFETRTGGAPFDGSQIYYPIAGNTTISATGVIQTDLNTMSGLLWDVTSKNWEVVEFNTVAPQQGNWYLQFDGTNYVNIPDVNVAGGDDFAIEHRFPADSNVDFHRTVGGVSGTASRTLIFADGTVRLTSETDVNREWSTSFNMTQDVVVRWQRVSGQLDLIINGVTQAGGFSSNTDAYSFRGLGRTSELFPTIASKLYYAKFEVNGVVVREYNNNVSDTEATYPELINNQAGTLVGFTSPPPWVFYSNNADATYVKSIIRPIVKPIVKSILNN